MFYSGGALKKRAVQEIIQNNSDKKPDGDATNTDPDTDTNTETDSSSESDADTGRRSRSRSRSRSMSVISHATSDADDSTDADEIEESNDYVSTIGHIRDFQQYHYSFVDTELDYDIEEFANDNPDISQYHLIIYQINTHKPVPFLEFLFYYEKSHGSCRLPNYRHKPKHNIRKNLDDIMNQLFTTKYRYKGFVCDEDTNECFVFYEKIFNPSYQPQLISLQKSHNWYWVCTTEIMNYRKYMTIPIDDSSVDFFMMYPTATLLQAVIYNDDAKYPVSSKRKERERTSDRYQTVHIDAPMILFYGSNICYAKNTAIYGLKREPIDSRFGPFYYFTSLDYIYYWACYSNAVRTCHIEAMKPHKRETVNGGISRYAVFTKRMKTIFIDDEKNPENVKKYWEKKEMLNSRSCNNTKAKGDGVYDSVYSFDYSWTTQYDTLYNGYYNQKGGDILRPVWCVHDHRNFEPLSYYEVDTNNIPRDYDPDFSNYGIL